MFFENMRIQLTIKAEYVKKKYSRYHLDNVFWQ